MKRQHFEKKENGDGYPWNNPSKHLFYSLNHSNAKKLPLFYQKFIYIYTEPMRPRLTKQPSLVGQKEEGEGTMELGGES